MGVIASQITSLTIVYSTVYSDADDVIMLRPDMDMAVIWVTIGSGLSLLSAWYLAIQASILCPNE